jgi:uncharacterized membrane protein HdeD (DUF308 family)
MENSDNQNNGSPTLYFLIGLKALLAIGIGLAFLINPMGMVSTFSYLLGIALLIFGGINIYNGLKVKEETSYWKLLTEDGVLQVIVGIVLLAWPQLTPNLIMIILGIWIILGGIIQFVNANKYKDGLAQRNFRGILAIILGGIIVFNPDAGVKIFSMIIGALSLFYGLYMVVLFIRLGKAK